MVEVDNGQDVWDYVNAAPTPEERQRRKDETFHLRYGVRQSGKSYAGRLSSLMIQSQKCDWIRAQEHIREAFFNSKFDMETAQGGRFVSPGLDVQQFGRAIRPKERRKQRRIRAQKKRKDLRNKLAGAVRKDWY
jgi:hypothetical protein